MRRILAITLLIAFSSPLILPLLASPTEAQSSLPACCRRNGAHHCNLGMAATPGAPAFTAPPCPLYPASGTPLRFAAAELVLPLRASIVTLQEAAQPPPVERVGRFFTVSANQKRGPPTAL